MKQKFVMLLFNIGVLIGRSRFFKTYVGANMYQYFMKKSILFQDKWNLKKPWEDA